MTKTILLVEDNLTLLSRIKSALLTLGHTVDTATYMHEARRLVRQKQYSIVVCDYMLPIFKERGFNNNAKEIGIDLLLEMQDSLHVVPPFILYTSSEETDVISRVKSHGGFYVHKSENTSDAELVELVKEKLAT